ncbi:glycosyltransferase [Paraglaciecola polaris]|uniref:Glycosyltransferase n=1 Tax=Paraglaciecola polaris LMG 21857 TaxID=1129793 RepID=K6ZVC9_9ALTE|nr:glycosyltransferase family A protein [Paraglaciecola polaris]GAC34247.1 glycosyltransferase [Paraglaciecola polaris LMG 21857]
MQISFIIPHKGRFEMLIQTIVSIAKQNVDLSQVEVIVVSQTPDVLNQTLSGSAKLLIKPHLRPENETISALRNFGVTQSSGQYLAFLDADVYLSENWGEQMQRILTQNPKRIIASAMQICTFDAPPLEKIRTSLSNAELDVNVAFLPGRNLFLRREAFAKIGGFPEHLITCEDYYFTDKAAQLGELFYTSSATYIHLGEDKTLKGMFDKEIWRGQSNLQSIEGRHIPLREWPSFVVPPAIFLFIVTSFICLFAGLYSLAICSLLIGLIPVMAYSIRLQNINELPVSFCQIFLFYSVYFPARAIGTFVGLFKSIRVRNS